MAHINLQDLTCPITWELFEDPVTLPCCGQNASRAALKEALQLNQRCPLCRAEPNIDVDTMPRNVALTALTETAKREVDRANWPKSHVWRAELRPVPESNVAELCVTVDKARFNAQPILFVPVVDRSGSMAGNPFQQVETALIHIKSLALCNELVNLKLIAYDSLAKVEPLPDQGYDVVVRRLFSGGGTNFRAAFDCLDQLLVQSQSDHFSSVHVAFMTDGESGEKWETLAAHFKEILQKHAHTPITVHCIGFGTNCDRNLLEALRLCGSQEGTFRYAEPTDQGDSLCNKLTSLFDYSSQGASVPITLHLDGCTVLPGASTHIAVDRKRHGTLSLWVHVDDAKHQVHIDTALDRHVALPLHVVPNESVRDRWLKHCIDRLAQELMGLATLEATPRIKQLRGALLRKRLAALQANVEDTRLAFMLEQLAAFQQGQVLNMGKLADMRFGSLFGGGGDTKAPTARALPSQIPVTTSQPEAKAIEWTEKPVRRYTRGADASRNALQASIMANLLGQMSVETRALLHTATAADALHLDGHQNTALHLAAYCGQADTVRALLARFPDLPLNAANADQETPVTLAAKKRGYHNTLEELLRCGAALPRAKHLEQFAIAHGFVRTASLIAVKGDDTPALDLTMSPDYVRFKYARVKDLPGFSQLALLEVALFHGLSDLVTQALSQGVEPAVDWVLKYTVPPKPDHPETERYLALTQLVVNAFPHLLEATAATGDTLLLVAVEKGSLPHVRFCLDRGANLEVTNRLGNTPLWLACAKRYPCIAEELLQRGANVDATNHKGNPPLYALCQAGPLKMVELLLAYRANLELKNANGDTLLLIATRNGQHEILHLLLRYAPPELVSFRAHIDGFDVVFAAVEADRVECLRVLHEHGVDWEQRTDRTNAILPGATPLHLAAFYGRVAAARKLLDLGVQVNVTEIQNGMTPLHLAVLKGQAALVHVLLQAGADPQRTDTAGQIPLDYCRNQPAVRAALVDPLVDLLVPLAQGQWDAADEEQALVLVRDTSFVDGCLTSRQCLDVAGADGMTPLIYAVIYSRTPLATLLLSLGCDPLRTDRNGLTAAFWCEWLRNAKLRALVTVHADTRATVTQLARQFGTRLFLGLVPTHVTRFNASSLANRMGQWVHQINRPDVLWRQATLEGPHERLSTFHELDTTDLVFKAKVFALGRLVRGAALSAETLIALNLHTSNPLVAALVNQALADQRAEPYLMQHLQAFVGGLRQLPPHQGEVYVASEGVERSFFEEGTTFSWSAVISASTLWPVAAEALQEFKTGTIFVVQSKTGRAVSAYSWFPFDSEVVLLPNACYRVKRWYRGDPIALGQANIREFTFGLKEDEYERYRTSNKPLLIEVVEQEN